MPGADADPTAPPSSPGGRRYRARHRRLRRWPRRVLIACNVVVVALIATACSIAGYAYYELNAINRLAVKGLITPGRGSQSRTTDPTPPFTVLIIGSDTRNLKTPTGLDVGNTQSNAEDLSDSIILARVAPATHQLALLSIPRDLFVDVPGLGEQKVNAAFAGGDPSRLIQVIDTQLGIQVNHFAEVNFDSFEQIADTIGGVEQYFPTPARDLNSGLDVPTAGCVLLQGAQALAFVRSREYQYELDGQWNYQLEPESDLGRIQRQQAFIKNAIEKAERQGDLSNIGTLTGIIGSVTSNITLDTGFSDSELVSLAEDFAHVKANTIPDLTYPTVNIPSSTGVSPGLERVPSADAAVVAQFLAVGARPAPASTTTTVPAASGSTATTSTTLPHDRISVEVENGSGTTGQAGAASSALQSAGYAISGRADASSFSYTANIVEYGPDGRTAAATLAGSLAGGATLTEDSSLTGTDLVLITGSGYAGLASGPGSTTTTSSAPATTTTTSPPEGNAYSSATRIIPSSSSFVDGVYIPPGRVPGQKISTCGD
jgi:LCP family protein required for cell wall assembly